VSAPCVNVTVLLDITYLQNFLIKRLLPASRYDVMGAAVPCIIFVSKRYSVILFKDQHLKLIKATIMDHRIKTKRVMAGR
jgi:hypothetical protein